MSVRAFYNEIDPYAAAWLRNLIGAGLIAPGDVDERSIVDVRPADLAGYDQCHFFAGIGGWSYALRLAGWPDDRGVWTGSCPCQPFSVAGKRKGFDDARHLWPVFRDLIAERSPPVVLGEQVASASDWLSGVRGDLEALGYAVGAIPVEAASVGAPHKRDRFWFVADAGRERRAGREDAAARDYVGWAATGRGKGAGRVELCREIDVAHTNRSGVRQQPGRRDGADRPSSGIDRDHSESELAGAEHGGRQGRDANGSRSGAALPSGEGAWSGSAWLHGADGKARRVEPGIRLLAHGVPARVGRLRAYGNAIVPQVAAEFIAASIAAIDLSTSRDALKESGDQ